MHQQQQHQQHRGQRHRRGSDTILAEDGASMLDTGRSLPESLTPTSPMPMTIPTALSASTTAAAAAAASGDAARTVFAFAPFWVSTSSWHCRHPDSMSEQSYLDAVGPHSADEVSRLYRNRQMKGSNLVVGLSASLQDVPPDQVPPAFFRTLGYLFEMAKAGIAYAPVTEADLQRGFPERGWCPPLWQATLDSSGASGSLASSDPPSGPPTPAGGGSASAPAAPATMLDANAATELLLSSAPFWCYLYNHEPARSKKTPPKTADEMLAAYRAGCLPDWAPMVGLGKEVATFNSLPPCLFMTLGSLVALAAAGGRYTAVGLPELHKYDKFFNQRSTSGSTQGTIQAAPAAAAAAGGGILPSPSAANVASGAATPARRVSVSMPSQHHGQYGAMGPERGSVAAAAAAAAMSAMYHHHHSHAAHVHHSHPHHAGVATATGAPSAFVHASYPMTAAAPGQYGVLPSQVVHTGGAVPAAYGPGGVVWYSGGYGAAVAGGYNAASVAGGGGIYTSPSPLVMPTGTAADPGASPAGAGTPAGGERSSAPEGQWAGSGGGPHSGPVGSGSGSAALATQLSCPLPAEQEQQQQQQQQQQRGGGGVGGGPGRVTGGAGPGRGAPAAMLGGRASASAVMPATAAASRAWSEEPSLAQQQHQHQQGGSGGAGGGRVSPAGRAGGGGGWQTAVFRLFLGGGSADGQGLPYWWVLSPPAYPRTGTALVNGPLSAEEMVLHYASGRLCEQHYVCGTTPESLGILIAATLFEPIGKLLADTQMGCYVPRTAEDLLAASNYAPGHGGEGAAAAAADEESQRQSYPGAPMMGGGGGGGSRGMQQQQRGGGGGGRVGGMAAVGGGGSGFRRGHRSHDGQAGGHAGRG